MMQPAENRFGLNGVRFSPAVARSGTGEKATDWQIRNTRPQRHMRARGVVMSDPRFESAPQLGFRQRDQPVQALPANCADDSFADRIRLRAARRGFQYLNSELADRLVEMTREDGVSIVEQESVWLSVPDHLPQLLQGPGRSRMRGDVAMDQAAAAVLDDHEYIQHAERRCDRDEEIAGDDSLRVQAQEGRPAKVAFWAASGAPG